MTQTDGQQLAASIQKMIDSLNAMAQAGRTATANLKRLVLAIARTHSIEAHGPRNRAADGTWQSDLCAAWLHDSCPAPEMHCDCTCHGGTVR